MSDYALGASSPLPDRKSPLAAGLLGLCLGPLGTWITPGTKGDLLVTGSTYAFSSLAWGGRGMFLGLVFAGIYGAARVVYGNARRDAAARAASRAAADALRNHPLSTSKGRDYAAPVAQPPAVDEWEAFAAETSRTMAEIIPPAAPVVVEQLHGEPAPTAAPAAAENSSPTAEVAPPAPEPPAPASVELPGAEAEPPSPPPPAPRKRGRPKGSGKLAA